MKSSKKPYRLVKYKAQTERMRLNLELFLSIYERSQQGSDEEENLKRAFKNYKEIHRSIISWI